MTKIKIVNSNLKIIASTIKITIKRIQIKNFRFDEQILMINKFSLSFNKNQFK